MRSAAQDVDESNEYCSVDYLVFEAKSLQAKLLFLKNEWKINIRSELSVSDLF